MTVYFFMIVAVIGLLIVDNMVSTTRVYVRGYSDNKVVPNKIIVFVIFLILVGLYTFRWCNGTDFYNYYMNFYSNKVLDISYITSQRDILFGFITYIFRNYISDNFLIYNGFLAILTYMPVIYTLRKYSEMFTLSILLYILMTMYFVPFNTVRQGIAVGIFFSAFPFLMREEYFKYVLFGILACMCHPTAGIAVVILFVCHDKFLSMKILSVAGILLLTGILLPSIWNKIIYILSFIGQDKLAADYKNALGGGGINILRVFIAMIPVGLALIFNWKLCRLLDKKRIEYVYLYMNVSIFNVLFVAVGVYNPVFARISQYLEIFLVLFYAVFIKIFNKESKQLVIISLIGFYFVYMFFALRSGGNLIPYQFNSYSFHI